MPFKGLVTAFGGGSALSCHQYASNVPGQPPRACPSVWSGDTRYVADITRVGLTATGGARFTVPPTAATGIALHLAPAGDRPDNAAGTPLRVTAVLADGRRVVRDIPRTHPALRNRQTTDVNGTYVMSTIRVPMPAGTVTAVEITGGTGAGTVDVRGVDMLGKAVPAPTTSGTTVIVDTAAGSAGTGLASRWVAALGGRVTASWPQIGVTVGLFHPDRAASAVTALRGVPGVQAAGRSGDLQPEKPRVGRITVPRPTVHAEPGTIASTVRSPQANQLATGEGVTIGIADTGLYDETTELAGRFDAARSGTCTRGGAFVTGPGTWRPETMGAWHDHGTKVASVAAGAKDGIGMQGVAPRARIVMIRVVSDDTNIYPESSVCAAMTGAALHLPVLNHSYGVDGVLPLRHGFWDPAQPETNASIIAVQRAFAWSRAQGTLNVAGTGNAGEDIADKPAIPLPGSEDKLGPIPARLLALLAEVPGVLRVAESQTDGTVAPSSVSGLGIVDVAAQGSGMVNTTPGQYDEDAGTSFASPAVAGAAALVKQAWPAATPAQVTQVLEATATRRTCAQAGSIWTKQPCRSRGVVTSMLGYGLLDARKAVEEAKRQAR